MRNVATKVVEKIKTHIFNRAVYEIIWKNVVQPGRPQITIWRMRIACRITKAINIHPDYILLIVFLLKQWLHECSSMLLASTFPGLFALVGPIC